MPIDLIGAVVAWLVAASGDAGVRLVRGPDDKRLLRRAVGVAVDLVVGQVDPPFQGPLRQLLEQCFSSRPSLEPDALTPVGEWLRVAIKAQVTEASGWVNNDTGRLFSEEVPVSPEWLAGHVTDAIVGALRQVVAEGGLAELVHGVDTADLLDRLDAIGLTVSQLAAGPAVLAGEAFTIARREYLSLATAAVPAGRSGDPNAADRAG